jgi:glucose/arabinose dehydrogenase
MTSASRAFAGLVAITLTASVLVAQQNSVVPQPRAEALPAPGTASPKPSRSVTRPEGMTPKVPAGFTVTSYAELRAPRMMVYAPNGDLFVSSPGANSITVLRDANNDGVFEAQGVFAEGAPPAPRGGGPQGGARPGGARPGGAAPGRGAGGPPPGFGGGRAGPSVLGADAPACTPPPEFAVKGPGTLAAPFGLAFHDGYLYVGNTASLVRYKYSNGDLKAQGEPEKLLDLPNGGHSTRNIVFNRAGTKMYIAVGSQSNNDAGEDCRRAAILEFNPDGTGYRVYASGIRNPVGLTLQPGTDVIWTAMNERDNLGDDLVPDYATSVKDGGFYG